MKIMLQVAVTRLAAVILLPLVLVIGCARSKEVISTHKNFFIITDTDHKVAYSSWEYGLKYNGKMGWKRVHHPEKYTVTFSSGPIKLVSKEKEIYGRFKDNSGKKVEVTYKEIHFYVYQGEGPEIQSDSVRYEFVDAHLLQ